MRIIARSVVYSHEVLCVKPGSRCQHANLWNTQFVQVNCIWLRVFLRFHIDIRDTWDQVCLTSADKALHFITIKMHLNPHVLPGLGSDSALMIKQAISDWCHGCDQWNLKKAAGSLARTSAMAPRYLGVGQHILMLLLAPTCMLWHRNIDSEDVMQTWSGPTVFNSSFYSFWYNSHHMDSNIWSSWLFYSYSADWQGREAREHCAGRR